MLYRTLLVCGLIALIVVPASVIAAGPMGNSAGSGKNMGQNMVSSDGHQGTAGQATAGQATAGQATAGQGAAGDQSINRNGFSLETAGKGTMLQTRTCDMQCLQNQTSQGTGLNVGSGNQTNRFGFLLETPGKGISLQTRNVDMQSFQDQIRNQTRLRDGSCGNCITP
jgi:hypothetical protein